MTLAYLFLFVCATVAFVTVWGNMLDPPGPEMIRDEEPWKPSGSYWSDCMRRGDCYCAKVDDDGD